MLSTANRLELVLCKIDRIITLFPLADKHVTLPIAFEQAIAELDKAITEVKNTPSV